MSTRPLPLIVASFRSALCPVTPAGGWMSPAVTSPGPCLRRYIETGSSCSELTHRSLTFMTSSTTSSLTPGIVVNSCSTPSILMLVMAAPGIELSRVRPGAIPRLVAQTRARGSLTELGTVFRPRRYGALTGLRPGDDERRQLRGLLPDLDDVVLTHAVRRDVHLLAVHREVPVLDQLAGHVPGLGVAGPVDHVVQARLKD